MIDNKAKLEQERNELNSLINKGVQFYVVDTVIDVHKRFFGLFRSKEKRAVKREFTIKEPTLATLDRLSVEWLDFAIDESKMNDDNAMNIARGMVRQNARRCARVIAIAVLGEERLIPKESKGKTIWIEDTKAIEELTDLFQRTVKPSKLYQLYTLINAMCNLGDFFNSMRLMQMARSAMPIRIETD